MTDSVAGAIVRPMPSPRTPAAPPRRGRSRCRPRRRSSIVSPTATSARPARDDALRADALGSFADSGPPRISPAATGISAQPALERAVAEHELQVLREEEDRPEEREERQRDRAAGGREAAVAEQAHVEHRLADAQLPARRTRRARRAARAKPPRITPSVQPRAGASMIAQTSAAEAEAREREAARVEARLRRVARLRHQPAPGEQRGDDDREVDEEDEAPVAVLDQPAAGHGPDHDAEAGDGGPDADRLGALVRGERRR